MFKANTLTELIENNRDAARSVTYLEGENDAREVPFSELYERALGIMEAHNAHYVNFYGKWVIEALKP